MFNVKINRTEENIEVTYKVIFQHYNKPKKVDRDWKGTLCQIIDEEKETQVSFGQTILNPIDNYSKNLGRKLALDRALRNAHIFGREERTLFWKEYFKVRGKVN